MRLELVADLFIETLQKTLAGPRVDGRFQVIEARLSALEKKPHLKFRGVHETGRAYAPGDAVTRSGSLWVCMADTTGTPGDDYVGWKLAVTRGAAAP